MMNDELRMKKEEKWLTGQKVKRLKKIFTLLPLILFTIAPPVVQAKLGISTRFVDVTLENVVVGQLYNLRQLRQMPYVLRNRSSIPVDVIIEVRAPETKALAPNYEPIPDTTWIQLIPNRLRIDANTDGFAEIVLQIPDDPKYVGKHYQAIFKASTVGTGLFSAAVESRFRFSTGPGPETLKEEAKRTAMMTLDFDITPQEIFVDEVEAGKKLNMRKASRRTLKVTNRAETPLRLQFKSVPWQVYPLPAGFEVAPDPSWLVFKTTAVAVPSDTVMSLEPIIQIPDQEEHYGKNYAFLVKTDIILGTDLEVFNRIYVRVKEKGQ